MRKLVMGSALALSLTFTGTAQADTVTTTFDGLERKRQRTGRLEADWSKYDQAVLDVSGGKALRISNAVTDGGFAGMPYSAPVTDAAGENEANNVLVNEFTVDAPDAPMPGLVVAVSPD